MLEATQDEVATFEALLRTREATRWPESNRLPLIPPEAYPFRGYTVRVSWHDGWTFRWHTDAIPDEGSLEEARPGVRFLTYSAD